ncbi:MAG TPA: formyltransferase family protein, partial [Candidatus Limnocylindrales bacterium]
MTGRIAVGVSGAGSNLRALHAAAQRGELGGDIVLVFADRPCAAIDWATEAGLSTTVVAGNGDDALRAALADATPDIVVLAGYMRLVGPRVLDA